MEPQLTEKTIVITPTKTYLRPEELVAYRDSKAMPAPDNVVRSQSERTEEQELDTLYSILRMSLYSPRIERSSGRTLAIWDTENKMARVIRKDGKFDTFGTTLNQQLYLEYFEALFLLESGRLQLEYHACILSIEQAYLLLLGENTSKKYSEYYVFAYLTRIGYILKRHKNKHFHQNIEPTETNCIWAWLLNSNERKPVPSTIKKSQMYSHIKRQLEAIKESVIKQQPAEDVLIPVEELETPTCSTKHKPTQQKRKPDDKAIADSKNKYFCACPNSFLDFMTDEPEYHKFIKTFQKIDIVKIKPTRRALNNDDILSEETNNDFEVDEAINDALIINFDLYLHSNPFRKSAPNPPLMRVVVLRSFESFPKHSQISDCSESMLHKTPILIVSVGDAKQIQSFLYFFT